MKYIKRISLILSLILVILFAFTACGADINSTITVDANFSGKRVIDVVIKNEDLSEHVPGGIDALKGS